jgi:flagellar biosynthesis protein FlhF
LNSEPLCFVGPSAQEVVAQIRSQLGPEAIVLNVRPVRPPGLARFWQKPMIEVLACRPQSPLSEPAPASDDLAELRRRMTRLEQRLENCAPTIENNPVAGPSDGAIESAGHETGAGDLDCPAPPAELFCGWRVGPILQRSGLLPIHAEFVVDQLRAQHGQTPPISLEEEISLARVALTQLWPQRPPDGGHSLNVLIGAPGSGKTTCLCKWLSQAVLVEGRLARVWRLDGATANLAQNLSVYCEVLTVPINRFWEGSPRQSPELGAGIAEDIGFIDLPGVDWRDTRALKQLAEQLAAYGPCQLHLVVNAAYDTPVLLSQIRAFASLPINSLIVTHLDEEPRWGKIWNLVLGTNYTIGYLSTGQNIPGDFHQARAETILADQFRCT